MAKISIIVPVYKVEEYLDRCIKSIINQTYNNLEIILVNDGSPDNCGNICANYALEDSRIKVIHKENGGLSDARNAGIEAATGDYLGFVDSDDYIHPQMYEILYNKLIVSEADISICKYIATTKQDIDTAIPENHIQSYTNREALNELFTFKGPDFVIAWNKLYRKDLFSQIRYPKGKIREDEFTTYKLLYLAKKIVYSDATLYYYFQSPNSIMRKKSFKKESDYAEAMEERLLFFKNETLTEEYQLALRRYCLWLLSVYPSAKNQNTDLNIKSLLQDRLRNRLTEVALDKSLRYRTRLFYHIGLISPYIAGKMAFHKLNRYNSISKIFDYIFAEPSLYRP